MITESDAYREHRGTTIAWALLGSLFTNALVWIIALFFLRIHVVPPPKIEEREYAVSSSSLTMSRRVVPRPVHAVATPAPTQQQPQSQSHRSQPQPQPQQRPQPQQQVARTAPLLQTRFSLPAHAPLSIATLEPQPPSNNRRTFTDINGVDPREHVEAVLLPPPSEHRVENGWSCYYDVHYSAQWSGGGTEEGTIPWPLCYPADHDAMLPLDRSHNLPIPAPPVGYVLPQDTPLGPLLEAIYQRQIHG